ncbi:MAG: hypothetical protein ACK5TG_19610, partial [Planctomyces sp.]
GVRGARRRFLVLPGGRRVAGGPSREELWYSLIVSCNSDFHRDREYLCRAVHGIPTGQQVAEDSFAFAFQLVANFRVVSGAAFNFGAFFIDGAINCVKSLMFIEQCALQSFGFQFLNFAFQPCQCIFGDEC